MPVLVRSSTAAVGSQREVGKATRARLGMSSEIKLRVLALHSFRTSAAIFKEQMRRSGLDEKLGHLVDFVYVDAPHPASGPAPADVVPFFGPPYREWWDYREDPNDPNSAEYKGSEETLAYLARVLRDQGPFDGFWAFSQGTMLSTVAIALQRQGKLFQDVPRLQFAILFGGFYHAKRAQQVPLLRQLLPPDLRLPIPSVHVIGERDYVKPRSLELVALYQDPVHILHPRGHTIPALEAQQLQPLAAFLEQQLAAKRRRATARPLEPPDVSRL